MQRIVPNLWFDNNAEEAVEFYVSLFPDSHIGQTLRYGESASEVSGQPVGAVLAIDFTLKGQPYVAINGGPMFKFTEAVSFMIECEDQAEIDEYWSALTDGGTEQPCGWLKDKFGLSWQVVPRRLNEMMRDPDLARAERVMHAMLDMKKIDLQKLEQAYVS